MPRRSDPNHCTAAEIEPFEPLSKRRPARSCTAPPSPPKERVRPAVPPRSSAKKGTTPAGLQDSRLHEEDGKLDIFR
eukprot:6553041-Prymnesium_polylepis.1